MNALHVSVTHHTTLYGYSTYNELRHQQAASTQPPGQLVWSPRITEPAARGRRGPSLPSLVPPGQWPGSSVAVAPLLRMMNHAQQTSTAANVDSPLAVRTKRVHPLGVVASTEAAGYRLGGAVICPL